ncbi:hypothetical protein ENUP19_0119G0019 [Entamoeba nuttalli]|uniref:GTP-binding protein, putative n=2 Tax=Entamoeba nuttalli TaxID=412467 RepID=K2G938_ENTNP|nr:GTP-binding protein, putative [Entamoeba nuttalli P19]EKE38976.1 GTP-binding protein, putative [Entamoeba nuttalli P19]|eukprot:XP_008858691.1 GTP-binding protein, putative [Entamoeba nuttalli P19]
MGKRQLILLVGLPYVGKSSIHRIVFGKKTPGETTNLKPTLHIQKIKIEGLNSMMEVWDIPGSILMEMDETIMREILEETISVVYVFTCQTQSFSEQMNYMSAFVELAHSINDKIIFEFLLHKWNSEGITDDKINMKTDVEALSKQALLNKKINIDFNVTLTSIYDNSLYSFFSSLLNIVYIKSSVFNELLENYVEKCPANDAFLIHIPTRLYIATTKGNSSSYGFCKEAFNFFIDVFSTYSSEQQLEEGKTMIQCDNHSHVYLKVVSPYLCLVMLLGDTQERDIGLYDYNFTILQKGIEELLGSN